MCLVLFGLTFFFPKMLYANIIGGLNSFYKNLCIWLNDKENYREESSHENHLVLKIVLFQFINSYLSLFYIAFYLQNIPLLKAQLFAIFMSKQMTGNLKESIIPYIKLNKDQMKIMDKANKEKSDSTHEFKDIDFRNMLEKLQHYATSYIHAKIDLNEENLNVNVEFDKKFKESSSSGAEGFSQPEIESTMHKHPDTFDDYLEMVKSTFL